MAYVFRPASRRTSVRTLVPALLLALLSPTAWAQGTPFVGVEVSIEPFDAPAPPLGEPIATDVHVRMPCALARPAPGTTVTFHVARSPAWSVLTPDPARRSVTLSDCEDGVATISTRILARANERAPAYTKEAFEVEAILETGDRGNASAVVEADAYLQIVAEPEDMSVAVVPGHAARFRISLTNGGNAPTRVVVTRIEAPEWLDASAFEPVILGSRFDLGEQQTFVFVSVPVASSAENVGRVGVVNVTLQPSLALDATRTGDPQVLSFTVEVKSPTRAGTPGLPPAALLLALAWLAALRRR